MLSFSRFLIISMKIVLILVLLAIVNSIDAPIYNYSYHIAYDETFVIDSVNYKVNGQKFYDPVNNRERVDRTNGRYNLFCGTVLPNVTTPCQQITADNKRWVIFPNKTSCCLCCDAAHGCGILKPSWLAGAQYLGQQKILDSVFDKWNQPDGDKYNYWWATTKEQIPRKLNENGAHIIDYIVASFHNQTIPFPESTFALPSYCNVDSPSNCPLESVCGKLRSNVATQ